MQVNKIYFSIPVSMDWDTASRCMKQLEGKFDVRYWTRNTPYSQKHLDECDAFVIMLPGNAWTFERKNLPIGLLRELEIAVRLGKKVYITYKSTYNTEAAIYEAEVDKTRIQGISGTSGNIKKTTNTRYQSSVHEIPDVEIEVYEWKVTPKTDNRILLVGM